MADYVDEGLKKMGIAISKPTLAVVCIIAGIMVILFPNLLVWIVGLFLVIQGALVLTDYFEQERSRTTAPRATATGAKVAYCHNCGARNTEEAMYCRRCGKEVVLTRQAVTAQPQEVVQ